MPKTTFYATSRRLNETIKILGRFNCEHVAYQRCLIEQHEKYFNPVSDGVRVMARRPDAPWAREGFSGKRLIDAEARIHALREAGELELCLTDLEAGFEEARKIHSQQGQDASDQHLLEVLDVWDLSLQCLALLFKYPFYQACEGCSMQVAHTRQDCSINKGLG